MRKIINIDKLTEITTFMIETLKEIEELQKKMNLDIEKLNECYKGKDADIIKIKYQNNIKSIDALKFTINSYIEYFKWLAKSYGENLESAIKNFKLINDTIDDNLLESKITDLPFTRINYLD